MILGKLLETYIVFPVSLGMDFHLEVEHQVHKLKITLKHEYEF
jgi:hypothetical protein